LRISTSSSSSSSPSPSSQESCIKINDIPSVIEKILTQAIEQNASVPSVQSKIEENKQKVSDIGRLLGSSIAGLPQGFNLDTKSTVGGYTYNTKSKSKTKSKTYSSKQKTQKNKSYNRINNLSQRQRYIDEN